MRLSTLALYTALALGANAAAAADTAEFQALAEGDMKKLAFTSAPKPAPKPPSRRKTARRCRLPTTAASIWW